MALRKTIAILILLGISIPAYALTIQGTAGARVWRSPNQTDFDFSISSSPRNTVVSGGGTTTLTTLDTTYQVITGAVTDIGAQITLAATGTSGAGVFASYESLDPSIATVNSSGVVTRVSNGTARINILNSDPYLKKQANINVTRQGTATTTYLITYASSSLAEEVGSEVDTRIAGKSTTTAIRIFSTEDRNSQVYAYNASSWLSGVDVSMVAAARGNDLNAPGTMVSPRHFLGACHYFPGPGNTLTFFNGATTSTKNVTNSTGISGTDLCIGLLESDLPSGFGFAKMLPTNWATYLPSVSTAAPLGAVGFVGGGSASRGGQFEHPYRLALVREVTSLNVSGLHYANVNGISQYSAQKRKDFYYQPAVGGDSGNPSFLIVNGELVYLTSWYSSGAGPSYAYYHDAINSAMTTLGGGYQLTDVDLSSFNTYP